MRIIGLKSENIKNIRAINIKPSSGINKVSGANAAGKTSLFDSIRIAIESSRDIDAKPIRHGESKAKVELDLGDMIITRTITEKGNTVVIKDKDGEKMASPQDLLNSLYNKISFDLMKFMTMDGKKQYSLLKEVLGIGDTIEKMEAEHKALYEDRAAWNKQAKIAQGKCAGLEADDMIGFEKVELSELVEELEALTNDNLILGNKRSCIETYHLNRNIKLEEIKNLEARMQAVKQEVSDLEKDCIALEEELGDAEPVDLQPTKDKMGRIEETNKVVDANIKYRETRAEVTAALDKSEEIDEKMKEIQAGIKSTIEGLEMPIAGLSMQDGDVLFNEVPVGQISSSEKLRVSMAIAIALNPKLKVILIKDASLLDDDAMAEVEKMAEEKDFQVWIELVDETGDVGIYIEDGLVVAKEEAVVS